MTNQPRFITFVTTFGSKIAVPLSTVLEIVEHRVGDQVVCNLFAGDRSLTVRGSLTDILDAIRFSDGVIIDAQFDLPLPESDHAEG